MDKIFRLAHRNLASVAWSHGYIIWKIPVFDIEKADYSTSHFIQESEYVQVGSHHTSLRLIVIKEGTVYVFACVNEITTQPCISHLRIFVGPTACPEYSTHYGVQ